MTKKSLTYVAFTVLNLLDGGVSAPIKDARNAATDGRALQWLKEIAPTTDWTALNDTEIDEIELELSEMAAAIKPSKVGAVENGVAAILGYTLEVLFKDEPEN